MPMSRGHGKPVSEATTAPPAAGFGAYRGGVLSQGHTAAVEKSWHRFRASLAPPNTLPGLVVYRSPILGEILVGAATAGRAPRGVDIY